MAFQDRPLSVLTDVSLGSIVMTEEVFRRFVSMVMQLKRFVNCELHDCTIELAKDVSQLEVDIENETTIQIAAPNPALSDYTTPIKLIRVTMSTGSFSRTVSMMIHSGHSVKCELDGCIIEPKEDVMQLEVEIANQPALQMVAPQSASPDFKTNLVQLLIRLRMSEREFRRLVNTMIQSGHTMKCILQYCTIESEEDVMQLQSEMEYQPALQMMAPQTASPDFTSHITLVWMTMSTGVFSSLISMVIQSGHSVDCELRQCTIKPEENDRRWKMVIGYQPDFLFVAPKPVSTDCKRQITLMSVTLLAGVFRRFVSLVIQSGDSVNCKLSHCTIELEEGDRQMEAEIENQSGPHVASSHPASTDFTSSITLVWVTLSVGELRRLVRMMIQAGHSVDCQLWGCTIEHEKQHEANMENNPVLQLVAPQSTSPGHTSYVRLYGLTVSAGLFKHLVSMMIQSGQSVNCKLKFCVISPEDDMRQLESDIENQPALQMVAPQSASTDYTTHISIEWMDMSAGVFRHLVRMVIQSGHYVNCKIQCCTIMSKENVGQPELKENQPTLQSVASQSASPDYTTHIKLVEVTMSAGVFRRLVDMVIQSRHYVDCVLHGCTIEPEEDIRHLKVEMENQPALRIRKFERSNNWFIEFNV